MQFYVSNISCADRSICVYCICCRFCYCMRAVLALFLCDWKRASEKKREERSRSKTEEYHNYDGISLLLGEYFNCIAKMHGHSNNNNKCNAIKANQCESIAVFIKVLFHFISFSLAFLLAVQTSASSVNKKCAHSLRSQVRSAAIIAPMYKRSIC